jgi:F420-dependent oxidoreductase-like protein
VPRCGVRVSLVVTEHRDLGRAVAAAEEADDLGLTGVWWSGTFGLDPLVLAAVAAGRTTHVGLGTSVLPVWSRHPVGVAQQAMTIQVASGGRFALGVGVSHRPVVESLLGLSFRRPVSRVSEYVDVVRELVAHGRIEHDGDVYDLHLSVGPEGGRGVPVLMAALGPAMSRAAGRHADGVLTWLAPPQHLANVVTPAVAKGAAAARRAVPPIVAQVPAVVSSDLEAVRAAAREAFGLAARLPFHAAVLRRLPVTGADRTLSEGWSDALLDAVVVSGDEDEVAARLREHREAGAAEIAVAPLDLADDPGARPRTLALLGELAGGLVPEPVPEPAAEEWAPTPPADPEPQPAPFDADRA